MLNITQFAENIRKYGNSSIYIHGDYDGNNNRVIKVEVNDYDVTVTHLFEVYPDKPYFDGEKFKSEKNTKKSFKIYKQVLKYSQDDGGKSYFIELASLASSLVLASFYKGRGITCDKKETQLDTSSIEDDFNYVTSCMLNYLSNSDLTTWIKSSNNGIYNLLIDKAFYAHNNLPKSRVSLSNDPVENIELVTERLFERLNNVLEVWGKVNNSTTSEEHDEYGKEWISLCEDKTIEIDGNVFYGTEQNYLKPDDDKNNVYYDNTLIRK